MTAIIRTVTGWRRALAEYWRQLVDRSRPVLGRLDPVVERLGPAVDRVQQWTKVARQALAPVTAFGWVTFCTGLVMLVLAIRFDWVEAMTIAVACLLLSALAVLWTLGRISYTATIEVDATRVRVGDHVLGRVTVSNEAGRTLRGTQLELPVGRGLAAFRVPSIAPGEHHEQVFTVPTTRRSVIQLGPVSSVKADPLGLLHRTKRLSDSVEVFVHPRTVLVDADTTGLLRDVEGIVTRDLSSSDVAFHALRDYVPGDDRRAVHWRSTARQGRLIVRQFEETRKTHLLVVLDLDAAGYADADEFEDAVSVAASLIMQAGREERQVTLVTQGAPAHRTTAGLMLDELCRVEVCTRCEALPALTMAATRQVPDATFVALIGGGATTATQLRLARTHVPPETRAVAVRCDRSSQSSLRRIADLHVINISCLDDFARATRSVA